MSLAADEHSWGSRDAALFFSGANLGFQRRNLSFTDWNQHREVRLLALGPQLVTKTDRGCAQQKCRSHLCQATALTIFTVPAGS